MVQHDSAAERRVGMNVDLKRLRDLALQVRRQHVTARVPQDGGRAVRLQRVKTFEVQEHVRERVAGRIAVADGHDVGAEAAAKLAALLQGVVNEGLQLGGNHHGGTLQAIGQ